MSTLTQNAADAREALTTLQTLEEPFRRAADLIGERLASGGVLLACGNGGSAADAAHLTTELICRFKDDRGPFAAACLNTNGGDLTAIGNDYDFAEVFARQVRAYAGLDAVLVVLSTSGRSENIVRALGAAREHGVPSVAMLGRDGGACAGLADVELVVPVDVTARVQECHKVIIHALCEAVEPRLRRARPS